jgi:hypothetical protein
MRVEMKDKPMLTPLILDVEIQIGRMQGWLLRAVGSVQKLVWSRLGCLSGEGLFKVYASR